MVVGMGWHSAVGLCQMAHRNMLKLGNARFKEASLEGAGSGTMYRTNSFDFTCEVRRDRVFPVWGDPSRTSAWSVYVDNLDQA